MKTELQVNHKWKNLLAMDLFCDWFAYGIDKNFPNRHRQLPWPLPGIRGNTLNAAVHQ